MQRDVWTPDGRLLVVHEGGDPDGMPVIAHHGTPGCGLLAPAGVEDAAARGIRLVSYDRPGYGKSHRHPGRTVAAAAADTAVIADTLGFARFATWGVSGGGPHALACAALLPERVSAAAVLASAAPFDVAGLNFLAGMGQDNLDEYGAALAGADDLAAYLGPARDEILATTSDSLAEALASLLPPVDVEVLNGPHGAFIHRSMVDGLAHSVDGWFDDDVAFVSPWGFDPASITVPVLLRQGALDLMVPLAHGRWLAGAIPGVDARFTDEDGHLSLIGTIGDTHAWLLRSARGG